MSVAERAGILSMGMAVVDVGKVIDAYPARDHLAFIDEISLSTGGGAVNMSVDMRQLGATFPIEIVAAVADDAHGEYIRSECERQRIDASRLQTVPDAMTSFTDVMVERAGGRRTFFHHVGANAGFIGTPADVRSSRARIVHVAAPGAMGLMDEPHDGTNRWVALLREAIAQGMHTNIELATVEPSFLQQVVLPCLPFASSIIINEIEAGSLVGIEVEAPSADEAPDWRTIEKVATGLVDLGVRDLAVVHMPAGAVAATADGQVLRQGSVRLDAAQVRSTTGAGDAYAAGVLFGIHEGWPIAESLRLGAASAAACLTSMHTSAGIRPARECLTWADGLGYRPTGS